jgi:hypothetical protein
MRHGQTICLAFATLSEHNDTMSTYQKEKSMKTAVLTILLEFKVDTHRTP